MILFLGMKGKSRPEERFEGSIGVSHSMIKAEMSFHKAKRFPEEKYIRQDKTFTLSP